MKNNIICKLYSAVVLSLLLVSSCAKQSLDKPEGSTRQSGEPVAFSLALDLAGSVSDGVLPVEDIEDKVKALHLSDEELRSANINLKYDISESNKFVVDLDLNAGAEMDAVVAVCKETQGQLPNYYAGAVKLKITDKAKRTYRIEQKGVDFYNLADGNNTATTTIDPATGQKSTYKVKVLLGAKLERTTKKGQSCWVIHYGLDKSHNNSPLGEGLSSMTAVLGKVPFVSDWTAVQMGYNNPTGEFGLTNNEYEKLKLPAIRLKPQGSILVFELENASSVRYNLRKLSVYSQSLTANLVYALVDKPNGQGKEFGVEPAYLYGSSPLTSERKDFYVYKAWEKETFWLEPNQKKSYSFWAYALPKNFVEQIDFPITSIDAKVMAQTTTTNGAPDASPQSIKRWYSIPIIKTYQPLVRLTNARVTKTKARLTDNVPIHPAHTFAHRFLWKKKSADVSRLRWREGNYEAAAYQPWQQINRDYASDGIYTGSWGEADIVLFTDAQVKAFNQTQHSQHLVTHPSVSFVSSTYPTSENDHMKWAEEESSVDFFRVPTKSEIAALFLVPKDGDTNKTIRDNAVEFEEQIKVAGVTKTYTTYMLHLGDRTPRVTYALKFLEKTPGGKYKFTPFTSAYRYAWSGHWGQNHSPGYGSDNYAYQGKGNRTARLTIQVRQLGGLNHQSGVGYQPEHNLITEASPITALLSKCIQEEWWSRTSPLSADDIVRAYPPLGYWNGARVHEVASTLGFRIVKDDRNEAEEFWVQGNGKMHTTSSGNAWHTLIMKATF